MATKTMHLGFFFATVAALAGCSGNAPSSKETSSVVVNGVALTLGTGAVDVTQGTDTSLWVGVTRQAGTTTAVDLDVTGEVAGLSHSWVKGTAGDDSSLVISVASNLAPGIYPLTVVGNLSGGGQLTSTLQVTVQPAHSTFGLSLQPSVFEIYGSSAQSLDLQVQRVGGFSDAVQVTVVGSLPGGLTVAVGANTADQVQLNVTADNTVSPGNYDLTVRGAADGETREVPLRVIVRTGLSSVTLDVGAALAANQNTRVSPDGRADAEGQAARDLGRVGRRIDHQAGGDREVQAVGAAAHGNLDRGVAGGGDGGGQALLLVAHHDQRRRIIGGAAVVGGRLQVGPDHNARPGGSPREEVGDRRLGQRHGEDGAHGRAHRLHGIGVAALADQDHAADPCRVGGADDGPEVAWIAPPPPAPPTLARRSASAPPAA